MVCNVIYEKRKTIPSPPALRMPPNMMSNSPISFFSFFLSSLFAYLFGCQTSLGLVLYIVVSSLSTPPLLKI